MTQVKESTVKADSAARTFLGRKVLSQAEFGKAIGEHNGKIGGAMAAESKAHADIAELNNGLWSVNGKVVSNVLDGTKRTLTIENDAGGRTEMTIEGGVVTERDGRNVSMADVQAGDQVECYCDGKTGNLAHVEAESSVQAAPTFSRRLTRGDANGLYPTGAYSVKQEGSVWNVVDAGGNVVKTCHLQADAVSEMGKLNPATFPNAPHGYPNPNNPNDINPSYPTGSPNLSNPPQNETLKGRADREAAEVAPGTPLPSNLIGGVQGETVEERTNRESNEAIARAKVA